MDSTLDSRLRQLETAFAELQNAVADLQKHVLGSQPGQEMPPQTQPAVTERGIQALGTPGPKQFATPTVGDVHSLPGLSQFVLPWAEVPTPQAHIEQASSEELQAARQGRVYRVQRDAPPIPAPGNISARHTRTAAGGVVDSWTQLVAGQRWPDVSFAPQNAQAEPRQPLVATLRHTEFWLNKVGIVLFLFGVAFLFKYAIDKQWIDEPARFGAGVLMGSILLALGLRLHASRRHFSQVLVGGAIATYYITGYAAYNIFPDLHIPYEAVFAFMGAATVLAFAISLWGDDAILSLDRGDRWDAHPVRAGQCRSTALPDVVYMPAAGGYERHLPLPRLALPPLDFACGRLDHPLLQFGSRIAISSIFIRRR